MIKPGDILLYAGAGLLAYLVFKGAKTQVRIYDSEEEKRRKAEVEKTGKEEVKKSGEFMLSWIDPISKKTRTTNLDTLALYLKAAIRGSYFGEDEEQIKQVMNSIPVSVAGKSGTTYPIKTIAVRYAVSTGGKNLKEDLVKFLSASELTKLGVSKHLRYL
jgi:hypothetical protein